MSNIARMMQRATAGAGGAGLDVDDVFSTFLYKGNNSTQTITNNIDLSGEGGLVWIKNRSTSSNHSLFDSESGATGGKKLRTNLTSGIQTFNGSNVFTTSSTGFALNNDASNDMNDSTYDYVSWSFRKAPKFFDVVKFTGNGVDGREISHSLNSTVGMILLKRTDASSGWRVYHRGANGGTNSEQYYAMLQATNAFATASTVWSDTAPSSTVFTVGTDTDTNTTNGEYVAYLFAHNDSGDGEFGPDSDQDIIKCGSYTGNGTVGNAVTLGFEPQWIMIKNADRGEAWYMYDVMRGIATGDNDSIIYANATDAELDAGDSVDVTSTGFSIKRGNQFFINYTGDNYIYMAIRRGSLNTPEDATKVFAISTNGQAGDSKAPAYRSTFPVDMYFEKSTGGSPGYISSRLTGSKYMQTNATNSEASDSNLKYDFMNGVYNSTGSNSAYYGWMWKRAPGYFDVVCYKGTNTLGSVVSHNLGVAPEMIWTKLRDTGANDWVVWHSALGNKEFLKLNTTAAKGSNNTGAGWLPTSTTFNADYYMGPGANYADNQVAYLFATVPNVSKCGSYTGNGSGGGATQTIDCGFSNGSRFILIKRTSTSGAWFVFDTVRGIVSGTEPHLTLNSNAAEVSGNDSIDPHSSGFTVVQNGTTEINSIGQTYIFYAIA